MKTPFDSNKKESLQRKPVRARFFTRLFKGKNHARVASDMEDDAPSSKIVKMLVVILVVHLVVIGGVALRGALKKDTVNPMAGIPASVDKAPLAAIEKIEELPPLAMPVEDPNISSASDIAEPVDPPVMTHITGPSDMAEVNATPDNSAKTGVHKVRTGDSWESIARDNKCSVAALKRANPKASLMSNTILSIPSATGSTGKSLKVSSQAQVAGGKTAPSNDVIYVLKSGDNLSRVARKFKTTTAAIQSYNKITDAQVKKLQIGAQIRIPKK